VTERPIDAVTFDFWDTLVHTSGAETRAARAGAVTAALGSRADELDPEALEIAFEHVFLAFNEAWAANRQFTAADAGAYVIERLGFDLDPATRERVVEAFVNGAAGLDVDLTPHVEETLVALKEREIGLAIICDVGLTPSPVLRGYLAAHGVLDLFDHWSFSDEVGHYKPARQIFEHALAGLGGVAPGRAAHVGDLRRTDVAGARAMGMTAVRYRGANDDLDRPPPEPGVDAPPLPEGDHVIADHIELLAVLGLD
jgi:putative hydrolase of the HAD superfamily